MGGYGTMTNSADGAGSAATRRTAAFLVGGIGLLLFGLAVQPRFRSKQVEPAAERTLFPELADPSKASSMEIVSFDDETATLKPFKVVRAGGVWTLPSHENYPADAKEQLAAACNELVDRPILDLVSTSPGDHEMYGVIEPDPEKIKVGATGVGRMVEFRDASGNRLARLIIGKEDNRPGPGGVPARNLRYVRKAGQDAVYRVEIDAGKFTTKFDDWIEKDLLKLSPWDVRRLVIEDYRLEAVESQGKLSVVQNRRNRIDLAYDDKDAKWSLVALEGFADGSKPQAEKLAADEELASSKLNDLRNALGDLKIVDVARKPAGLSADLKADAKFTDDPQATDSMRRRGFLPLVSGEILSTDGETIVGMKDGVEYVLRFGASTTVAGEEEKKDDAQPAGKNAGKDENAAAGAGMGRYLLVMARFDESLLEKPALDPLPEVPAVPGGEEKREGEKPAADAKADGDAAGKLAAADEAEAKAQAALEERRRVERENRRKQEEYDEKVKAAQKRVKDLNTRFADWYYVVSNAEFAKIHLDRAGVIQPKAKDEGPK